MNFHLVNPEGKKWRLINRTIYLSLLEVDSHQLIVTAK